MRRGDIHGCDLGPQRGREQAGRRPVLIFQADHLQDVWGTVIVIPFTSSGIERWRPVPTNVLVPAGVGGLTVQSVALCHQISVVDKDKVHERWGTLPPNIFREIEDVVLLVLGLAGPV